MCIHSLTTSPLGARSRLNDDDDTFRNDNIIGPQSTVGPIANRKAAAACPTLWHTDRHVELNSCAEEEAIGDGRIYKHGIVHGARMQRPMTRFQACKLVRLASTLTPHRIHTLYAVQRIAHRMTASLRRRFASSQLRNLCLSIGHETNNVYMV